MKIRKQKIRSVGDEKREWGKLTELYLLCAGILRVRREEYVSMVMAALWSLVELRRHQLQERNTGKSSTGRVKQQSSRQTLRHHLKDSPLFRDPSQLEAELDKLARSKLSHRAMEEKLAALAVTYA